MTLPEYLKTNIRRIKNQPVQDLGNWSIKYDAQEFSVFEVVGELKKEFPGRKILREDVIRLFKEDKPYLAFVAAMVWGFIDASRPRIKNGGKEATNFYRALSQDKPLVLQAIDSAKRHLKNECFVEPFTDMLRGNKYNIPGIDYRYFTKIFFFAGQSDDQIKIKPLIFDKWTSNAFFALLTQSQPEYVKIHFRELQCAKFSEKPGEAIVRTGSKLAIAYESYVRCMSEWAAELSVPEHRLEQFVFGASLKKDKKDTNPRKELWEIAISNAAYCDIPIKKANN